MTRWQYLAPLALLLACGNAEKEANPGQPGALATRDPAELFAWEHVPTIELTLPADKYANLLSHALDEEYTSAEMRFEGTSLGQVGMRFKGSIGTLEGCVDAQGRLTCPKLSMKLGFDEYTSSTRFFRQKRLNLHSMVWDETKLHERLAYDLYREMGVVAPRSAWATVKVNGESLGLFSMVEQVDGRFTSNRWPGAGDGNLYKEAWPLDRDATFYAEHLEAAKDKATASHAALQAFSTDLAEGGGRAALERYMDTDYLAAYMAVDDAILNLDGVTATYSGADPQWYQNHNFYVYQEEQRDFFWLIPWDMDATFTPRGDFEKVPRWNAQNVDCMQTYTVWGGARVTSPACDPLFSALRSEPSAYDAAVEKLLAGPFSEANLNAAIDRHVRFITAAMAADPKANRDGWQSSVAALKTRISLLRKHLQLAAVGASSKPLLLSLDNPNDFEQADDFSVALGSTPLANTASSVSASLATGDVLAGSQELKLDFEYRNQGTQGFQQWTYFPLLLEAAPSNLSALTGVRFLARTDRERVLRIDLESSFYEAQDEGIKFGWEVPLGPEPKRIELRFANAALPVWAHPTSDVLANVIAATNGVAFQPFCAGRDASGLLPAGTTDKGSFELDELEFF